MRGVLAGMGEDGSTETTLFHEHPDLLQSLL
jgi:hypothetical protein